MHAIIVPGHIRGLIFDCDGTLVDSMPRHMLAWEHAIKSGNGTWEADFFFARKGMPEQEIVHAYNARYGTGFNPSEIVGIKHRFFHAHGSQFLPIPHVVAVVHAYRSVMPMAVASGGTRENVELELDAIGLRSCFSVILTADDDLPPKPAPDLFLEAARRLGVSPEFCQVFEDGEMGLQAARDAGMLATDIRE